MELGKAPGAPQCEARRVGRITGVKCMVLPVGHQTSSSSRLGQSLEKLGKAVGVLGQSGYEPRCARGHCHLDCVSSSVTNRSRAVSAGTAGVP